MDVVIPVAPVAITTLVAFFSPYAIAAINAVLPFVTSPLWRRVVAVVVSLIVAAVSVFGYFVTTGEALPSSPGQWFGFGLLALVVSQFSYAFVTKDLGAEALERSIEAKSVETRHSH